MPSPAILLEAAKPGPPLDEKAIKKKQNDYEARFAWGFKGTHSLPPDYQSKQGRRVYTPPEWRRVGIEEDGAIFYLVQLVSRIRLSPTDLKILGLPATIPLASLSLSAALETGAIVEAATHRLRTGNK